MAAGAVAAARGSLLGLVLGDAVGATAGLLPESGTLLATSGGQLACFTVEGLVRADVHGALRGEGHPSSIVWHAYGRWAAMQGLISPDGHFGADSQTERWPDGWLAEVSVLREHRGTAPATMAVLREPASGFSGASGSSDTSGSSGASGSSGVSGSSEASGSFGVSGSFGLGGPRDDTAPGASLGPRAVTRTLPVGLYARAGQAAQLAAEIAALTHRDEAVVAAAVGATAVQLLSEGATVEQAAGGAQEISARLGFGPVPEAVAAALAEGRSAPREADRLTRFTADASAPAVLAAGLYVAASFPEPEAVRAALLFASSAGDGGHVATVTGALLGAAHGPDALPVDWLARLELVWVADTLARDLVRQLTESPAGSDYSEPTDPHWWERYPGW